MDDSKNRLKGFRIPRPPTWLMLGLYTLVATTLGIVLGWLVIRNVQWAELGDSLSSVNILLVIAAWAFIIWAGYLRGLRWRLLLDDPRPTASRLFLIEQTGTALDTLSPIRVLDEIVEIGILVLRDNLKLGTILATLALQRTFEFGTTVLLLGGGALLMSPFRPFWPFLVAGVAFGSISLILLFTVGPALRKVPVLSKIEIIPQFASAVILLRQEKRRAIMAFLLSVHQAVLIGLSGWMIAQATHISLGMPAMIVITIGIMFFSSTVPGLPMALGTFEFAAVSILALWGVDREQAIAFALVLHAVLFLPPILFAMFFLPREGLLSARELKSLTLRTRKEISSAGSSRFLD